jgi:hypothetical protein
MTDLRNSKKESKKITLAKVWAGRPFWVNFIFKKNFRKLKTIYKAQKCINMSVRKK